MANEGRAEESAKRAWELVRESLATFNEKNKERGDIFKAVGAKGAYLEIRTCTARLRKLIWDQGEVPAQDWWDNWMPEVKNVCEDLRNFSVMLQMCAEEFNLDGREFNDDF